MEQNSVLRLEGIYRNGYGIVPKFVMHDPDLSLESKAIYTYLCALAGSGEQTFPYRDTILRHLGLSKNTYYRHYNPLIGQGYITVRRPLDKTAANIYTLVSNPKKLEDKHPAAGESRLGYRGLKAHGYGSLPKSVMLDGQLTIKSKGLYAYLCSYCGAGNCAFPKRDDILFHLGISEPTYYKCYKQLQDCGYLIAVQRKEGSRFGVNDYYLNEYPEAEKEQPNPSAPLKETAKADKSPAGARGICDFNLPYPNFRDIKNRDLLFWDTENCDTYINNNLSKNNPSINSLSIRREETDRSTKKEKVKKILTGLLQTDTPSLNWLREYPDEQTDKLLERFMLHFQAGLENKQIRNLSAYMKASLVNWLEEEPVRMELGYTSGWGKTRREASYDLKAMERMIERGDLLTYICVK